MLPVGHLAFALLPVVAYTIICRRRLPNGEAVLVLLVSTQLPDLIDKPLAWTFGVLPSGRMLAHSLVVSIPILTLGAVLAHQRGRGRLALLFGMGYLSHIVGDFYQIAFLGTDYYFFPNLFWPLLRANPDKSPSFGAHAPSSLSELVLPASFLLITLGYSLVDIYRRRHMEQSIATHTL
ncbi:metal-dependent hydrolase [Halomicroarcula limicola]|uniref:Metal-dependent hydrolase n=1 Tax=Haloarcula limicola TaxID=1429915 RepID=A0A8J7Y6Z7_9EURY|nr:metal-dependent hydrolase [Halomicroarcula limicola]MBV0925207.1 metal-dependent hydrolase [Halomicroarcula limicola]